MTNLIIPLCVTIIGWIIVNELNRRRDRKNYKRDLRTKNLIDIYRYVSRISMPNIKYNPLELREKILMDIQLFGTDEQIKIAQDFIKKFVESLEDKTKTRTISTYEITEALRIDLRNELDLKSKVDYMNWSFTYIPEKSTGDTTKN